MINSPVVKCVIFLAVYVVFFFFFFCRFGESDQLPLAVRERLEALPKVMNMLELKQAQNMAQLGAKSNCA